MLTNETSTVMILSFMTIYYYWYRGGDSWINCLLIILLFSVLIYISSGVTEVLDKKSPGEEHHKYFAEHKECTTGNYEIIETLTDDETCNPKICLWCQYSTNGKRDPARSITLCDGCRYNENFEHIEWEEIDNG